MMNTRAPARGLPAPQSELAAALASCRGAFIGTAMISGMSNILQLTGSLFMLEVYDRVLPSRSVPTLIGLIVLVSFLYAALGVIDAVRSRILARVGAALDEQLSGRVYDTLVQLPLRIGGRSEGNQPLRDLDAIRSYLSSLGPVALFDLPWIPLYLGICFIFHPLLGFTALVGAIILICLTLLTEHMLRAPNKAATEAAITRNSLAEASRRNAEALTAMGMVGRMSQRWGEANRQYMLNQGRASDVSGGLGSVSKVLRMMLQSGVLAVGAYLVINQQASSGIIIASSILSGRALAPVDLAISNWKGFTAARSAWARLNALLAALPARPATMALQPPTHRITVEAVSGAPPGVQKVVVPQKEIASCWCAFGAASADILHVYEQVDIQTSPFEAGRVNEVLAALESKANAQMDKDGIEKARRRFAFSLDMRHRGQINEVEVMLPERRVKGAFFAPLRARFTERYEQLYGRGSSYADARLEIVTLRLRATAATPRPKLSASRKPSARIDPRAKRGKRSVYWAEPRKSIPTPIYDGAFLVAGNAIKGPAVVETTDTTVVVHPGRTLKVDKFGNFEIDFGR